MTTTGIRPTHHKNRNSAIYLGTDPLQQLASTPPGIPDLPEPPSPVSSNGSGLPSPPATNSTGSGSTGDPASIALRQKKRPFSLDSSSTPHKMLNEANIKTFHTAFTGRRSRASYGDDDDDDDDNVHDDHDNEHENGEDDTARLDRRQSLRSTSENAQALERVKSLTERNRMALNKLSSYSRGTPSPNPRSTASARSPPPASSASSSSSNPSSSSSRPTNRSRNAHHTPSYDHLSGSETERESLHPPPSHSSSSNNSTNLNRAATPVASESSSSTSTRARLKSAPASPGKALQKVTSTASDSPSRRRSKRVSLASQDDVTEAALVAVASSRRSPTVNLGKKRQPLPREFRDSGQEDRTGVSRRMSLDAPGLSRTNGRLSVEPNRTSTLQLPPRHTQPTRASLGRSSAVRGHQTRWMSEDLSSPSRDDDDEDRPHGRRQTIRGGSAESALTAGPGNRLVGEGLRAAGLAGLSSPKRKSTTEDVFRAPTMDLTDRQRGGEVRTRAGTIIAPRASTSMAQFRGEEGDVDDEPLTAPLTRSHKSAYPLMTTSSRIDREREREVTATPERAPSSLARYSSPAGTLRRQQQQPPPTPSEHTRLMMEGLSMFESNLHRYHLPPDLFKNAQAIAHAADRLNDLLRSGTSRALEEQIRVEVEVGNEEILEVWRQVGGEYRDGMRVSDELVRSITLFLLGVGRLLRDLGGGEGASQHGRSVSLDDAEMRSRGSLSPDAVPNGSSIRRTESRNSWERLSNREKEREDTLRRLSSNRPESSVGHASGSSGRPSSVLNLLRDRETDPKYETPQSKPRNTTPNGHNGPPPSSSMRRLYTPRDRLSEAANTSLTHTDSQETLHGVEPSPTPASRSQRQQPASERSRTLPPLSIPIPRPLPSLPSEQRRKTSTMRGPNFPTISTPNATTALTPHTVTNSPVSFPLTRSDSNKSNSNSGKSNVTFSRPSTVSVSALSGLQLADQRKRTLSSNSNSNERTTVPQQQQQLSGSETEREGRRRTMDRSVRMSLDGYVHPADRSAAVALQSSSNTVTATPKTRERRRTVVDIWPAGSNGRS